ncbi:hypothetical protein EYZ11_005355 [Aspergillus tanneri]|uniref:Uncharacterized protein n=1 Tax=Aspergillus tanneri TaxID=1220188 RepID=A0A4S3JIH3_9EURO|nr:hypothetical protein EYZ11_005355 [Aspergillus tanneri]
MQGVKRFLEFWNLTFGAQASITCPETISYALKQLGIQPKSQKPGLQLLGKVQDNTQSTSSGSRASTESCPADMSEKSRIAFILDDRFESSNLAGFISSPITRVPESLSVSLENPNESQIPSSPRTDDTPGQPNGTAQSPSLQFSIEKHQQRSDVFSMIENLRSSSPPGNTPRELGFMTPPHLRNLHNADREAETPQTPTLPPIPADNEEDFLGSSPTPGTRDRTHTGGSSLHTSLMAPAVSSQMDTDPPSSPPEVKSQSPNSENKSANTESMATRDKAAKNRRRRQKKKEKRSKGSTTSSPTKQPDAQTTPKDATENNAAAQSEQPLSSRLRSSASKMPLDPPAGTDPTQSSQAPSSSSNKESTARGASVSCHPPVEVCDSSKKQPGADYIADSSSDDMETQIASQLEQDLELAVDLDEPGEQPAEPSSQPPMTRKRKRETHETAVSTPSNYERRRSSRLSSTKDNIINDVEEARTETCSKKLTASNPTENNRSSPAESVPQKRRRHSKGAADEGEVRFAVREQCYTNRTAKATDPLDASSQKRRSTRLSGHVASVEETPVSNSPRSSRSRRQSTKQKEPTPKASQMKSVASEARTDPTAKTKLQDEVPVNVEINKVSETCESQTNAQTSEPASPSKEQLPTDSIDIQMSDAAGALIKKDPKIKITGSRSVGANSSNTDADIIPSLHQILDNVKSSTLDRRALKQIDDLLFDIRVEMHEALRRHTG